MLKIRKPLLQIYLIVLIILYAIGFLFDIVLLFKGMWNTLTSAYILFFDPTEATRMFSYGIYQIIISSCIFSLLYVFAIGSVLSPMYARKLIGKSKLPIGRKKF